MNSNGSIKSTVCLLTVMLCLASVNAWAATIEVSQPSYGTTNSEYDRNPSIINDGTNYWLFYTKGDDTSTSGIRGPSYDPDADTYVVYYKTAGTIAGLAVAAETKLDSSETYRPANFDQRVVSATSFGGKVYAFVSSGQSGTDRGLYYYEYSGGNWIGPRTLIADATARGGHVNVTSDNERVYIVWESSDGSSDCYTWDGSTLNPKVDISNGNQPKITLFTGSKGVAVLYVVNIEDGTGDIEVFQAATDPQPAFGAHSTAIPGAGLYDPCIFNDGTDLYVVSAPWVGGEDRQYLVQTKSVGTSASWAAARTVCYGGHSGTSWWEYWPCGYHDGSNVYVFFTTETSDGSFYSDGEIAHIKMDWNLGNDHYFHIKNAVAQAATDDEIQVANGTYLESNIVIPNSMAIQGESRSGVIVAPQAEDDNQADNFGGNYQHGFIIQADNVIIQSLTIDGEANTNLTPSKNNYRIGIVTQNGQYYESTTVDDVSITHTFWRGMYLSVTGAGGTVNNCSVNDVEYEQYNAYGILLLGESNGATNGMCQVTNSQFSDLHGRAIGTAYGNFEVSENTVDGALTGLYNFNWGAAHAGRTVTMSGNAITDVDLGMNLVGLTATTVIGGPNPSDRNTVDLTLGKGKHDGGVYGLSRIDEGIGILSEGQLGLGGNKDSYDPEIGILVWWTDTSATIQNNEVVGSGNDAGIWIFHCENASGYPILQENELNSSSSDGTNRGDGTGIFMTDDGDFLGDEPGWTYAALQNNAITGWARAVDLYRNASSPAEGRNVDASINANTITGNATGVLTNGGAILSFSNNIISGNAGDGVQVSTGLIAPTVGDVFDNFLSGNGGLELNNSTGVLINASGNWWGSSDPSAVAGEISADIDYTPWLNVATDADTDTPGFQGDFSTLWVDDDSPQTGSTGRIHEGIGLVTGSTVNVAAGTYNETIIFDSDFDKDDFTISGNADAYGLPSNDPTISLVTGGVKFSNTLNALNGLTIENLYLQGNNPVNSQVIGNPPPNQKAVTGFTLRNSVIDAEDIAGRDGFMVNSGSGREGFGGNFTINHVEFKDILTYGVMELFDGTVVTPFDTITFTDNWVHDCNGVVALRGHTTSKTTVVNIHGNTWSNIGGNNGEPGQAWAALEVNRAVNVNIDSNIVDDVSACEWGEGEALQLWDVTTLHVHGNTLTNNHRGIWIWSDGSYPVPGGSITFNTISGNTEYGIMLEAAATGGPLNAECNWWGHISGPYHATINPMGQGNSVSDNVDFEPWNNDDLSSCEFTSTPDTVWVDDDYNPTNAGGHYWGHDAFDNIQDGADRVGASVVIVAEGTYVENVVISKSVDLIGSDSSTTIINGNNVGNTVTITASDVTLSGFKVTGGWANGLDVFHPVGGVVVDGNSGDTSLTGIIIEDNIIDANPGNGVYVSAAGHGGGTDNVVIQNCRVSNNGGANAGISLTYPNYIVRPVGVWDEWKRPKNILVQGNIIYGNSSYGVYVSAGQHNVIRSNIIRDNSKYGLQLASSWNRTDIPGEYTTVDSNDIYDNARNGVKLTSYNQYNTFTGNAIYNNGFGGTSDYYKYGILFQDGNDNAISDNTITGNALGGLYLWGKGDPSYTWYSTTNNTISGNIISDHTAVGARGIYIPVQYGNPNSGFLNSNINGNRITNNSTYGLENADATQIVDASGNWWGAYCGPHHPTTNSNGQGDEVSDYVDYEPWCDSTFTECDFSTTPPSMVWVDDGYTPLGENDGHYWCYDAFDKIQDGVDAVATGGTVNVAAGTYEEQVRIDGKGVELVGTGVGQSIIEAVPVVDRVTYTITQWTGSSRTIDACIGVTDAGIVNISGFTVDGKELGPDNFYGIHYFNTGGSVIDCRIEDITDAAHPSNSRIVSLLATHGDGETITIEFSNNVIPNFQKGGIVVMGPGATFTVNDNSVSGVVSSSIAGNCIQLSYGATGTTASNYVEGTAYTGPDWASTGILLFECGDISMDGDSAYNCEKGVNFSDWGWIHSHPVPVNLGFANLVLDNNEWSLGTQLSRDNSDVNMTVTDCDISNSTGDGIDFYCTGAGSYYTGWDNGDLNAMVTGSNITGSALDGIWGADYSGNANNVSISVNYCMFSGNVGSAINNGFTQMMDATACYWDHPNGPTIGVKSGATRQVAPTSSPYGDDLPYDGIVVMTEASKAVKGTGETIYGLVDYSPWWGGNYVGDPHTDAWTWYVNASNSSTIQEGIDAASSLDTLRIRPDTYEENAVIDKSLALLGAGRDSVLVYPATSDIGMPNPEEGPSFRGSQIFVVEATDVTIEGFTLDGDSPTLTPEGTIDARNGIITNYNTGDWSNLKVRDCTAKNIYLRAIYASAQTPNNLSGVDFSNNTVSNVKGSSMQSAGIMLWGSSGDAKHNDVSDASIGIFYHWNSDGDMDSNTVTTSELGLGVNNNDSPTSISHNTITDSDQGIQTIAIDSPVNIELNQITACTSGVILYGGGSGETNVWENDIEGLGTYGTMGVYASTDLSPWGMGDLSANLKRNTITDNFYGIVLNEPSGDVTKTLSVLIGGASTDYNLIYNNLNYEMLLEYCNDDQTATYNYWSYSLYPDIEDEIFHQVDQASLGLVAFHPAILHGDVNLDGEISAGDIVYLLNYLYRAGDEPPILLVADVNRDGEINGGDVLYLINYLYRHGDPPFAVSSQTSKPKLSAPSIQQLMTTRPVNFRDIQK